MDNILIEPTFNTPYVSIDYSKGILEVRGSSSPINVLAFYQPIFEAIRDFSSSAPTISADFGMEFMNTSSTRCIFLMLKELKELATTGKEVTVNWMFEEDDHEMLEVGEDFQELVDVPFNFVETSLERVEKNDH
ncbi:MAG: DUF1987 domain-containing protein [Cyclobacteriaceae bacterium]|nr:DUF1987 domain-containing protein [Cyclobacteriaceae bacterium HetDA_MAG_MS6]